MRRIVLLALPLLTLVSACGGDSSSGPKLSVSPGSVTVHPRGEPVAFTATLEGATDTIRWTLNGPGTLDVQSGPTVSYRPPVCFEAGQPVVLEASAAGARGSASIVIVPESCTTVAGRLLDGLGNPMANAPVLVEGLPTATTDADGRFLVEGVLRPYNIAYQGLVDGAPLAVMFVGVTRMDPTLHLEPSRPNYESVHGTISGSLSGGAMLPLGGDETIAMMYVAENGVGLLSKIDNGQHSYEVDAEWIGAPMSGVLHALEWRFDPDSLPVAYEGYALRDIAPLTPGATLAGQDLTLAHVETTRLKGKVTRPAGYMISERTASLEVGTSGNTIDLLWEEPNGAPVKDTFSYLMPRLSGFTATVHVHAQGATNSVSFMRLHGLPLDAADVELTLAAAAEGVKPGTNVTIDPRETDFRWNGGTGPAELLFIPDERENPSLYIVVLGNGIRPRDLSAIGFALPSGAKYSWLVRNRPQLDAVEGFLGDVNQFDVVETATVAAYRKFTVK